MKKSFSISPDISFPEDAITQKFAFLGRSGSGKTYAATKLAEGMLDMSAQLVVLDPVGVWNGLRTAANGRSKGYSIPVLGGQHGDLPLLSTAGTIVANLVIEKGISVILDVSLMRKNERKQFVTDFAEQLFHLKKSHRSPLHLMIEEAQVFIPQRIFKGEERMLGAMEDIVKLGRNYGIGISIISQRPQSVHKDCLNQTEALLTFQINGAHERKAIEDWVVDKGLAKSTVAQDLSGLEIGSCFLWSPQWLRILKKIRIDKKKTFDASATPLVGRGTTVSRELAPIDMQLLNKEMESTIEQVKENDPKELKKKISELQRELSKKQTAVVSNKPAAGSLTEAHLKRAIQKERKEQVEFLTQLLKMFNLNGTTLSKISNLSDVLNLASQRFGEISESIRGEIALLKTDTPTYEIPNNQATASTANVTYKTAERIISKATRSVEGLGRCESGILSVLAQRHLDVTTKSQAGILSGYSTKSGGFNNAISKLKTSGFITADRGILKITEEGLSHAGQFEPMPSGADLHSYWYSKLNKSESSILKCLVDNHPKYLSKNEIGEATNYSSSSGGFNNALSKLRTLELIEGYGMMKASDNLF